MKRILLVPLIVLSVLTVIAGGWMLWSLFPHGLLGPMASTRYIYYTLKDSRGFVLARTLKGESGQPLGAPQKLVTFGDDFGLVASDSVSSLQLSPDGNYLAINGVRDHGEQVWIYDVQNATMTKRPLAVLGNFLHWLPTGNGHSFLYRPMFPLGPDAPMDDSTWNPGLWLVNAQSGEHRNIDIGGSAADIIDASPSPDGSRIAYSTTLGLGLGSQVFLMNSDGSGRVSLFHLNGLQSIAGLFAWSPDGSHIAYERLADSPAPFRPASLWTMDDQGGQQEWLADVDGGHGYAPVWSPDGGKIAFVARTNEGERYADLEAEALQSAIKVVDVHSHQERIIASAEQTGQQININPSWPTNDHITFTTLNTSSRVLGSTPRYWSAPLATTAGPYVVRPISETLTHVVAQE